MNIVHTFLLCPALLLVACGGADGGQGQSSGSTCTPGDTKACACSATLSGLKACGANKTWQSCECGGVQPDVVGGDAVVGTDATGTDVPTGDLPGGDDVDPGDPCANGSQESTETDVDCGGSCPACGAGKNCKGNADCLSDTCTGNVCMVPAGCGDNSKNGGETDVDCGGPCGPCATTKYCSVNGDCLSATCIYGVCKDPTCGDSVKNQGEVDVDCAGPCAACADGKKCGLNGDCANGRCENGACSSCQDGKKNGGEIDVDCGTAAGCSLCDLGQKCTQKGDCASNGCEGGKCCQANACGVCTATPTEVCDGKDNDCNGLTDEYLAQGAACPKQQGVCAGSLAACYGAQGWKCTSSEYRAAYYAYAESETGVCDDGMDNDCDGKTDYDDTGDCCLPQCGDKTCGDDGCSGSCGSCEATEECYQGACRAACGANSMYTCQGYCGQITGKGGFYCSSSYCSSSPSDCTPDFQSCCGSMPCTPACAGKDCGDDGCGGSCGTCSSGYLCDAYGVCEHDDTICGANPYKTCSGHCGNAGLGSCYCDSSCSNNGDCCPDFHSCCD